MFSRVKPWQVVIVQTNSRNTLPNDSFAITNPDVLLLRSGWSWESELSTWKATHASKPRENLPYEAKTYRTVVGGQLALNSLLNSLFMHDPHKCNIVFKEILSIDYPSGE